MRADRFERLQAIFEAALERDDTERAGYVRDVCGEDIDMRDEVLALLRHEERARAAKTAQPFALAAEAFDAREAGTLIGQTIGRYRLEAEIASGGMGRVFKARRIDGDIEQIVALKLIRRELFNEALLQRFSDERRILASLNHPGIAHLIDAGTDAHGAPFVAMEYVDGLPLPEYCARKALSIRERLVLFRQVVAAVSYAHRNLIVHRDLKPTNVLVTMDGRVKLLDFGVAKILGGESQNTATAMRFMTPAYAAPEQRLGDRVTVACDVYALGAVMYALLAGVGPFDAMAMSAGELERYVLKVPPEPLRAAAVKRGAAILRAQGVGNLELWAKRLDGDLDDIVQKALRKEPDARYVSVDRFDEDLQRYLEQRPVLASGASWLYRARKFCERNAAAVALSAIVSTVGIAGVGYMLKQNSEIRTQRDRIQAMLDVLKVAFQAINPEQSGERNYSQARVMLAAASREVDALETSQPELFRGLAYELGEIELNLGMMREGLALIQRANRSGAGASDKGLLLEIHALIKNDEPKAARAMLDSQRTRLREFTDFRARQMEFFYEENRYEDAIALGERLLSDPSSPEHALSNWPTLRDDVRLVVMKSYAKSGKLENAISWLGRIVDDRRQRYGDAHPLTLVARLWRAQLRVQAKDFVAAERELMAMKPFVERNLDHASDVPSGYHNTYGQLLGQHGKSLEALEHFKKALVATEIAHGADSENAAAVHFNIAQAIFYSGQDRKNAYPHFQRAMAGAEKKGLKDENVGLTRLSVAKSYVADRDFASVRKVLAPPHALIYFEAMSEPLKSEYVQALSTAFGPQDCATGWEAKAKVAPESIRIARTLVCRYQSSGQSRATN